MRRNYWGLGRKSCLSVVLSGGLLGFLAGCKVLSKKHADKKEDETPDLCLSNPQCAGQRMQAQQTCSQTIGARWDSLQNQCVQPQSLAACQQVHKDLVYDGEACVSKNKRKTFYQFCIDPTADPDIRHTVAALLAQISSTDCRKAYAHFRSQKSLSLQGEELKRLEPLQGFVQLEALNLWKNLIVDVTPLGFLVRLRQLNLGHNQISNGDLLASLTNLRELLLFENALQDVTKLKALKYLKVLDVERNPATLNAAP